MTLVTDTFADVVGTLDDIDGRELPGGSGAVWKKLAVEPGAQSSIDDSISDTPGLPHARFSVVSGEAVCRYGDGEHVESEGTSTEEYRDAHVAFLGLYAPYVIDGLAFTPNQGVEVTLRRKFRPSINSNTTMGGIDLELLLCQDPANTFAMYGNGGSRGCYALSMYVEDYYSGSPEVDDSPDFYPFGWAEITYNWSSTDPNPHAFTATADIQSSDGHVAGDPATPGSFALPPIGGTFKMRFERFNGFLSGYIDDVLVVQFDLPSETMLAGQYLSSSLLTMPVLTDGVPGLAVNDTDSDFAVIEVRAYNIGADGLPEPELDPDPDPDPEPEPEPTPTTTHRSFRQPHIPGDGGAGLREYKRVLRNLERLSHVGNVNDLLYGSPESPKPRKAKGPKGGIRVPRGGISKPRPKF